MNEQLFMRLMLVLLLMVCGGLMLLDVQRQRELYSVRREVDNLHGRMNAHGLLDNIGVSSRNGRESVLRARSNDELNHLAQQEQR